MRQALEDLIEAVEAAINAGDWKVDGACDPTLALIRAKEALAQPEQEPVAWATREDFYRELDRSVERIRKEMEIKSVTMRCKDYDLALPIIDTHFGRVLVGQVSTPPQPEQEPVAVDCCANCLRPKHEHMGGYCPNPYTTVWHAWDYPFTPDATPPQRKPLTDEGIREVLLDFPKHIGEWYDRDFVRFIRAIEAAHGIKE